MPNHFEVEDQLNILFEHSEWASHPRYPVEDWDYEVAQGNTRQSYRTWLYNQLMNDDK